MEKYIFIERDGVVNVRMDDPVVNLDQFMLLPFVTEAIMEMNKSNMRPIILACEDLVHTGELKRDDLMAMHESMIEYLGESYRQMIQFELCSEENAQGRTCFPSPTILQTCAQKYNFELENTYYITSRLESLHAAWAAGCKSIFVRSGKPFKTLRALAQMQERPDFIEKDLLSAIWRIQRIDMQTAA